MVKEPSPTAYYSGRTLYRLLPSAHLAAINHLVSEKSQFSLSSVNKLSARAERADRIRKERLTGIRPKKSYQSEALINDATSNPFLATSLHYGSGRLFVI